MLEKTAKISPNACGGTSLPSECTPAENSYVFCWTWGQSCVRKFNSVILLVYRFIWPITVLVKAGSRVSGAKQLLQVLCGWICCKCKIQRFVKTGKIRTQLHPHVRLSRTAHLHRLTTFHNQSADISASEGRPLADFRRIGEHSDCFANTV